MFGYLRQKRIGLWQAVIDKEKLFALTVIDERQYRISSNTIGIRRRRKKKITTRTQNIYEKLLSSRLTILNSWKLRS